MRAIRVERSRERNTLHSGVSRTQKLVRSPLDPLCYLGVGRTAISRVVLEPAILRRVVRRGNDDAVGEVIAARAIVNEYRVRNDRRRLNPSARWITVSTPFAARTSRAVRCAGPESACVSLPM
jgi:hypothetical protein